MHVQIESGLRRASRHRQLLDAINSGASLRLPSIPTPDAIAISHAPTNNRFAPTVNFTAGSPQQNEDSMFRLNKWMAEAAKNLFEKQLIKESRYGGLLSKV